jgi:hypothetical protein
MDFILDNTHAMCNYCHHGAASGEAAADAANATDTYYAPQSQNNRQMEYVEHQQQVHKSN